MDKARATKITIEVGYQDTTDTNAAPWTEQATGHRYWTFPVDMDAVVPIETIADAVYAADNAPSELSAASLVGRVRAAMQQAYRQTSDRHHSLSVGDRVRVGEVEVVCAGLGWNRVREPIQPMTTNVQRDQVMTERR